MYGQATADTGDHPAHGFQKPASTWCTAAIGITAAHQITRLASDIAHGCDQAASQVGHLIATRTRDLLADRGDGSTYGFQHRVEWRTEAGGFAQGTCSVFHQRHELHSAGVQLLGNIVQRAGRGSTADSVAQGDHGGAQRTHDTVDHRHLFDHTAVGQALHAAAELRNTGADAAERVADRVVAGTELAQPRTDATTDGGDGSSHTADQATGGIAQYRQAIDAPTDAADGIAQCGHCRACLICHLGGNQRIAGSGASSTCGTIPACTDRATCSIGAARATRATDHRSVTTATATRTAGSGSGSGAATTTARSTAGTAVGGARAGVAGRSIGRSR